MLKIYIIFILLILAIRDFTLVFLISDKKPMYAQISEWRKVLTRLSYFLRSVDYLILELLRRIVITSTRDLLNFLIASFHIGNQLDDGDDDDVSTFPIPPCGNDLNICETSLILNEKCF